MPIFRKLSAKDTALVICFTATYAVFAAIPLFRILGMTSQSITATAITAPIVGAVLGPYIGSLSAILGGLIGFFTGSFSPMSFFSGIFTTLSMGLLCTNRRRSCVVIYSLLLVLFGFYPSIGPAWLFPPSMWFQIVGLMVLVSPVQALALRNLLSSNSHKSFLAFFVTSLTATLAGQIAGSLAFEFIVVLSPEGWTALWFGLMSLYPIERVLIALAAALVAAPLYRILKTSNLTSTITTGTH